ncbi:hypothetical protein [Streptomyces sp. NPDC046197]|uniref:hypothetical protein n=1 Tax=Streptomyces sp. NPDC046197 TaxID=3154337 RepID=UPI0033EB3F10
MQGRGNERVQAGCGRLSERAGALQSLGYWLEHDQRYRELDGGQVMAGASAAGGDVEEVSNAERAVEACPGRDTVASDPSSTRLGFESGEGAGDAVMRAVGSFGVVDEDDVRHATQRCDVVAALPGDVAVGEAVA